MSDCPPLWVKRQHANGCDGAVINKYGKVHVDRLGRLGNGGIVAHVYECNRSWAGCGALVLVAESTFRAIAAEAVGEVAS